MHLKWLLIAASLGWEGKVHFTHNPPRKSGGSEGAIHFAPGRVRLEEPTPAGLAVVIWDGKKLVLLFPEKKTFMEMPAAQAALSTAPPLDLGGMTEAGRESIDGQECTIYERKGADVTQRLWVPADAKKKKLFFFLREATITPRGATRADVSDVRFRAQPDALFQVPRDFAKK